jgi:2-polyprenyl-6-methoxyphenol hydroxylase-like FAD-dependent oxidoreductase
MMMGNMPSAAALSDLMTLLKLLEAAKDPKQSAKAIEVLQAERKQYDDAIQEASVRASIALAAEANAARAAEEAGATKKESEGLMNQARATLADALT